MTSITKRTSSLSESILSKIKEQFTSDQQQMFVQSFQAYLKHDPVKDFVVNLDEVYKWIGFTRKDNAKRLVISKFEQNSDFSISLRSEGNTKGRKEEVIMLNIDTFKNLCMLANTSKGKEVRKMYIKMELVLHQLIEEENLELREQLNEQAKYIKAIEAAQSIYEEVEKTGHVYVLSTDKPGTFKVGRSKNEVKKRVSQLQTAVVDDIIIEYDFGTSNEILLENIMHYILDRYRTNYNREHFTCRKEYIISVLKLAGNTLDTLKSSYQKIEKEELIAKISDKLEIEPVEKQRVEVGGRPLEEIITDKPLNQTKTFFRFLSERTRFEEGTSTPLESIKDAFSMWVGSIVKSLDKGTLYQVNPRFTIQTVNICKSCHQPFKAGCCDQYRAKNKSSIHAVNNLVLL